MAYKKIPILILHGWKLPASRYAKLQAVLQKRGYKVYVPDLPGNGVEAAPATFYTLDDYRKFVQNYLTQKNIGQCLIIGHSFGGRVGIKLATACPQLVSKLILTGVPGFPPVAKSKIKFYFIIAKVGGVIFGLPGLSLLRKTMRRVLYRIIGNRDYYATSGIMRQTFQSIIGENLAISLRKIKQDTLLLWGENDRIVPIFVAKKMKKIMPRAELVIIKRQKHSLPWKRPVLFVEQFEQWNAN